jgi:hypothetical protein
MPPLPRLSPLTSHLYYCGKCFLKEFYSLRKWKMKLKEWNFEKNLKKSQMDVLVAKAAKRSRDENKDTIFYYGSTEISNQKIRNFKKRRMVEIANLNLELANAGEFYVSCSRRIS